MWRCVFNHKISNWLFRAVCMAAIMKFSHLLSRLICFSRYSGPHLDDLCSYKAQIACLQKQKFLTVLC